MAAAPTILGIALCSTAIVMIVGRQRIGAHAQRRGTAALAPPILWLFLGTLLAMNGLILLLLALA